MENLTLIIGALVWWHLIIPIHELGHYIAIKVFGGNVHQVALLAGKPRLQFGKFTIGFNFINGYVLWDEDTVNSRLKKVFISLSGALFVLIHSILLFSLTFLLFSNSFSKESMVIFYLIVTITFFIALAPLWPFSSRSDGYKAIQRWKALN